MLLSKLKPIVALGVMIIREGRVLLAKRKGALGLDTYGFPGGKLEGLESFEEGIMRELREECGAELKVKNLRFVVLENVLAYRPKHFVNIGFVAEWVSGEAINTEPNKHEDWQWCPMDALPQPLFVPSLNIVEAYKSGQVYRDGK